MIISYTLKHHSGITLGSLRTQDCPKCLESWRLKLLMAPGEKLNANKVLVPVVITTVSMMQC